MIRTEAGRFNPGVHRIATRLGTLAPVKILLEPKAMKFKPAPPTMAFALALTLTLTLAGTASQADNCAPMRAQIESKIKAAGVTNYSVVTVDSAASAAGKVVGSCGMGTKKIMYAKGDALGASPPATTPASKIAVPVRTNAGAMLTECKDGTVSVGGDCKK